MGLTLSFMQLLQYSKVSKYDSLKKSPLQVLIEFLLFFRYKDKIQSLKWSEIYSLNEEGHVNVLAIIDLVLTLPSSSAANERGFSQMKLTKTNTQCRMNNTTLNHLMIIQMATPKVKEFDPDPAINRWINASIRPRRPLFYEGSSRKQARPEKHETDIVEVVDEPARPLHEADVMDVGEDTTATPGPAQPLLPELEEEEDVEEVLFREKADDDDEDEEVISDYESEAEMSEEMVLKKLGKNCCEEKLKQTSYLLWPFSVEINFQWLLNSKNKR